MSTGVLNEDMNIHSNGNTVGTTRMTINKMNSNFGSSLFFNLLNLKILTQFHYAEAEKQHNEE
jgi:hypothetical protein